MTCLVFVLAPQLAFSIIRAHSGPSCQLGVTRVYPQTYCAESSQPS